jgi:hypothetical protein
VPGNDQSALVGQDDQPRAEPSLDESWFFIPSAAGSAQFVQPAPERGGVRGPALAFARVAHGSELAGEVEIADWECAQSAGLRLGGDG